MRWVRLKWRAPNFWFQKSNMTTELDLVSVSPHSNWSVSIRCNRYSYSKSSHKSRSEKENNFVLGLDWVEIFNSTLKKDKSIFIDFFFFKLLLFCQNMSHPRDCVKVNSCDPPTMEWNDKNIHEDLSANFGKGCYVELWYSVLSSPHPSITC